VGVDEMSLNAILEAIQESSLAEIATIEAQSRDQVEIILSNARAEAEKIQQESLAKKMSHAQREEARVMLEAHSKVLQIMSEANQALINEALNRTREQLANLRGSSTYPAILRQLTVEALDELYLCVEDEELVSLRAHHDDQELLGPFLGERFPNVCMNYDLYGWGGVITQNRDSSIVVINTLEERFERSKPHLLRHLAMLFEGNEHKED
jgi:vacuolar-type H+-ATPase subunit E/Vma4